MMADWQEAYEDNLAADKAEVFYSAGSVELHLKLDERHHDTGRVVRRVAEHRLGTELALLGGGSVSTLGERYVLKGSVGFVPVLVLVYVEYGGEQE